MRRSVLLLTLMLLAGCKRGSNVEAPAARVEPAAPSKAAAPQAAKAAEVEASGKVLPPGPHLVAFLTSGRCDDPSAQLLGSNTADQKTGGFFFEIFAPQGQRASLCGARLEGGKVTALAVDGQSPRTLQGTGEIEVRGELTLQPVQPFDAPAELQRRAR